MIAQVARRGGGPFIILVALWGGLIPFVGPLFGFSMGSGGAWTWTTTRAELHVIPAAVAALGALLLIRMGWRAVQVLGAGLVALAGVWFVIGPSLSSLWTPAAVAHMGGMAMGAAAAPVAMGPWEAIGYHYGPGALLMVLGAFALGAVAASPAAARRPVVPGEVDRALPAPQLQPHS